MLEAAAPGSSPCGGDSTVGNYTVVRRRLPCRELDVLPCMDIAPLLSQPVAPDEVSGGVDTDHCAGTATWAPPINGEAPVAAGCGYSSPASVSARSF